MAYVNCRNSQGSYKVTLLDTQGDRTRSRHAWFTRCALCGDDEEIGFDCGKAVCPLYSEAKPETRGRKRKGATK